MSQGKDQTRYETENHPHAYFFRHTFFKEILMYWLMKVKWFIQDIVKGIYFMIQMYLYKRHLKMRIDKNNFGRREEW